MTQLDRKCPVWERGAQVASAGSTPAALPSGMRQRPPLAALTGGSAELIACVKLKGLGSAPAMPGQRRDSAPGRDYHRRGAIDG